MPLTVNALKREFEIRTWQRILRDSPYVAVFHLTAGRAWGRTNMKARVLASDRPLVGARFAAGKYAREGARRTRYVGMAELFRGMPSAVVYGGEVDDVVRVVKRAQVVIDGGVLVGGRFGEDVVGSRVWQSVLDSEGERAEWGKLVGLLATPPAVLRVLEGSGSGLCRSLENASGGKRLVRVLDQISNEQGR